MQLRQGVLLLFWEYKLITIKRLNEKNPVKAYLKNLMN